ncbi:MAG TPA: EthD family reductase [Dehalococcoidia bacterium]|nr:EthD family reductase [Dehalococcoidia bacterium]
MAIKRITAANENLTNGRSRVEAQHYWAESHGKLVANSAALLRYHHYFSLPEAYEADPKPTFIGISMFWRENHLAPPQPPDPNAFFPVRGDDEHVFDRSARWPIDDQHADILGEEHVIIDGATKASMVNAIFMVVRKPGLDHRDFFDHWLNVHGPLAAQLPGLRRYIQCPVVLESFARGTSTHDGWSEFWFDDFWSFQHATESPEWAAMEADGATLFCPEKGIVIGREYVQKDDSWKPRDWGLLSMTEDQIRARLLKEDYGALLTKDPDAPAKIKAAAQHDKLGVWTPEHLVTLDESRIDARPSRWPAWHTQGGNEPAR